MRFLRFRRGAGARKVVSEAISFLSLVFIFQTSLLVLAQDAPAEADNETTTPVSAEAEAAATADLQVSAEAAKELTSIDLDVQLEHEGYDGLVPADGFLGTVVYPLKEAAWNVQEGVYDVFASESSYAQLTADHADLHLLDATEQITEDPDSYGTVAGILEEYKDDLAAVTDAIPAVKAEDPTFAKDLSAEIAGDHGFIVPKVLGSIVDTSLTVSPEFAPQLLDIKNEAVGSAVGGIVAVADNEAEVTEALKSIATAQQSTPFSGIGNAENLTQAKQQLGDTLSSAIQGALDEVISGQLKTVEENIRNLPATDEVKGDTFKRYVEQLPGQSVERMKMMDQFKSQADLSPLILEKCQEIKAKVAEAIGAKIKNLVQEEVRKAMSQALLDIKNPGVDDFKILTEMQDLIPDEQIKKEIGARHEEGVQKFLTRFGDDQNAQAVTAEFQTLTRRVQSGEVPADANFFKTLEGLKSRLAPEQQTFIDDMSKTGRQEMLSRFQNDQHFAERFSTFNPADVEIYKRVGEGQFGGVDFGPQFGPPPGFNFAAKFQQIEQQQAANFGHYLEFQNRPEDVQAIQQQFQNVVPQDIRQRFETQYHFDDAAFQKHEDFATEKHEFFQQKFQEIQKQYQEQFGQQGQGTQGAPGQTGQFPGGPTPFPGTPGFGFPGIGGPGFGAPGFPPPFTGGGQQGGNVGTPPGYLGPPVDSSTGCPVGQVKGPYGCEFHYERPINQITCPPDLVATAFGCEPPRTSPTYPTPTGTTYPTPTGIHDPAADCAAHGGTWTGTYCKYGGDTTTYPTPSTSTTYPTPFHDDPAAGCASTGGTWTGTYCKYGGDTTTYPTPSTSTTYPTPSTSTTYPTPSTSTTYPTPSTSTTYPTPSTSTTYPTPSTSTTYPTPSTSTTYPTPSTSTTYPTPSTSTSYPYPTPHTETSYPTPATTTTYPTPSYPTPAESYPTPAYATPAYAYPTPAYAYPTPSYAYPTPAESYPYPTPHAYNYPIQLNPGPQVAGAFTGQTPRRDIWGPFDFLAFVGLGVWSYYMKKQKEGEIRAG